MLHVLFIADDTSRYINRNFYYLEQELKSLVNLTVWRKSGNIDSILRKIPVRPNFILLLNDMEHKLYPMIKGLANIDIPTGLFVNDIHRLTKWRESYFVKQKIDYLFTVARDPFIQTYYKYKHKMEWLPHFVNTEIYKDYHIEKDIDLLLMGAVNAYYPLRQKILKFYSDNPIFTYHHHPGYRDFTVKEDKNKRIGKEYAKELNRAKILFTCPSILHYPVMKYFEALACKTLLLAPTFRELEDLGFVPGKHFIAINEEDFQEKAAYYLANKLERERIAEQGYQFIREAHTVKTRAIQLVKIIERAV